MVKTNYSDLATGSCNNFDKRELENAIELLFDNYENNMKEEFECGAFDYLVKSDLDIIDRIWREGYYSYPTNDNNISMIWSNETELQLETNNYSDKELYYIQDNYAGNISSDKETILIYRQKTIIVEFVMEKAYMINA